MSRALTPSQTIGPFYFGTVTNTYRQDLAAPGVAGEKIEVALTLHDAAGAIVQPAMRDRQERFYRAQLRLARRYGLPVILHVRKSADALLKGVRELRPPGGIAHAFSGSAEQARAFLALGFKLGFGGAATFDTARRLRALAAELPPQALVLETDAPDIPPQWLYTTAAERAAGRPQGVNSPAELPRIGAVIAGLRGLPTEALAELTTANALAALPRLAALHGAAA